MLDKEDFKKLFESAQKQADETPRPGKGAATTTLSEFLISALDSYAQSKDWKGNPALKLDNENEIRKCLKIGDFKGAAELIPPHTEVKIDFFSSASNLDMKEKDKGKTA